MRKETTWIDGAADTLARRHGLQTNFVKHWIIAEQITSDKIQSYYNMPSLDLLNIIWS